MRSLSLLTALTVLWVLAAGCGGGEEPSPVAAATGDGGMSAAEYVQWCGARPQSSPSDYLTWGEAVEAYDKAIRDHEAVTPPRALMAWHNAKIKQMAAAADAIREKFDLEDYVDELELFSLFGDVIFAAALRDSEAAELPESIHGQLVDAGCIDEES